MNSRRAQGTFSILAGASLWGLFWIPLRHIDENGVTGLWAVAISMAAALIPALPVAWRLGQLRADQIGSIAVIGLGSGISLTLYSLALIETDVIRAIFLFYALPIWTAIFGFVFLKESLSAFRLAAIATGLGGLWMLLEQVSFILKRLTGFPRLPARRGFRRGLVDHKGAATLSGGRGKPAFGGLFKPISGVAKLVRCPTSHGTSRLGEWACTTPSSVSI